LKGIWGEIERKGFDCSKNKGVLEINDEFREEDERMKGLMWNGCLREIQYRNSFFFLVQKYMSFYFILDIILILIKTKIDRHSLIFFGFFFFKIYYFFFLLLIEF
jgi:hypothetical protein